MFHFYHHLKTLTEKWNSFLIIPASKNKKESSHVACVVGAKKGVMEQDKKVKGEGALSISTYIHTYINFIYPRILV